MKGSISIDSILFKNGATLQLEKNSIVLFVGANNSGKSLTLRELNDSIINHNHQLSKKIIVQVTIQKNGTLDELLEFLNPRLNPHNQYAIPHKPNRGTTSYPSETLVRWWTEERQNGYFGTLEDFFVKILDTTQRLLLIHPPSNINFTAETPTHPIHVLKLDESLEQKFSKLFKKAFKEDLIVNHGAGSIIPLHVGKRPESTKENDRVSLSYISELNKLGQLQDQGDGMKSFTGVLLSLFAENYSINIVDEPEAFLHPPQARLLGEMMAKNLDIGKQLFIATHSEHFLKGVLENSNDRLIVVRLNRDGDVAHTTVLDNSELKTLWKDPILKHSNILDGLFHSQVILCESDSDSRFFSAIASSISSDEDIDSLDTHYIQAGGKHKFPTVASALKKINVPLTIIADFDILNNENPLKELFNQMGGDWEDIKTDFNIVKKDIDSQKPELDTQDLKTEVQKVLDGITSSVVSTENIKNLEKTIKKASAWAQAKQQGKNMLRAGDAVNAFNRLEAKLKNVGIVVLQVGEIEAFDKTVGNHGPKWVNEVLEKDLAKNLELNVAREFVKKHILQM